VNKSKSEAISIGLVSARVLMFHSLSDYYIIDIISVILSKNNHPSRTLLIREIGAERISRSTTAGNRYILQMNSLSIDKAETCWNSDNPLMVI
jgi:hypothetical protein